MLALPQSHPGAAAILGDKDYAGLSLKRTRAGPPFSGTKTTPRASSAFASAVTVEVLAEIRPSQD
jgi:hypothetical protein